MKLDITKKYTNGEVTVVWKPALCIHSTICFKGLPEVFNPNIRPWIKPGSASTVQIINQVKQCPSGALTFFTNSEDEEIITSGETIVEAVLNGPLMVYGNLTVKDKEGNLYKKNKLAAFCRCGASGNKPFCDGSHKKTGFIG